MRDLAQQLPVAVAAHALHLRMPGGAAFADGLRPGQARFWKSLAALAGEQRAGEVFEDLHGRYADSPARPAPVTSLELAATASMTAPVIEGVKSSHACGTGNLLHAVVKKMGAGAWRAGSGDRPRACPHRGVPA